MNLFFINSDKSKELNQRHRKRSRQSTTAKQKKNEFEKLFSENMHRFDMLCDLCPKSFHSFDEAKTHYAIVHNNRRGYIKCCNLKFFYRCNILKHLYFHLEKYKCVLNIMSHWLCFYINIIFSDAINVKKCAGISVHLRCIRKSILKAQIIQTFNVNATFVICAKRHSRRKCI